MVYPLLNSDYVTNLILFQMCLRAMCVVSNAFFDIVQYALSYVFTLRVHVHIYIELTSQTQWHKRSNRLVLKQ